MYTNKTKIFGILGFPLGHTLSPWIHNTLFEYSKYDGVYLVFENEEWPKLGLSPLKIAGVKGLSVTIPFKEWAFQIASSACEASKTMKASNTLLFEGEDIIAKNTDGEGALRSILETDPSLLSPKDSSTILVLGSGGSAKGILFSLVKHLLSKKNFKTDKKPAKKIRILARNHIAVSDMIQSLGVEGIVSAISNEEVYDHKEDISLVIHTTPVGMKGVGGDTLLEKHFFHKEMTLFDIVYNPLETELVKLAKAKRSKIIPGYSMLLYQGIRQFEYFTKLEVEKKWIKKIEKILLSQLKNR